MRDEMVFGHELRLGALVETFFALRNNSTLTEIGGFLRPTFFFPEKLRGALWFLICVGLFYFENVQRF